MKVNDIESQLEAAPIETENPWHLLINRIRGMVKTSEPPLTSECCIYRIPKKVRKVNEAAYTPRVISIGPFHGGKEQLQTMEKHKERNLRHFLMRANQGRFSVEGLVTSIKELEERVRRCYAETIDLNSDELVNMILLNGSFIIGYIIRCEHQWTDENDKALYTPWLKYEMINDLMLLENQLPFFVLEKLFNLAFSIDPMLSFLELACDYFSKFNGQNIPPQGVEIKHFTDLVRYSHLPSSPRLPPEENKRNQFSYSAMELRQAGVRFKVSSSKCLFDIQFTNGQLKIPPFIVEDISESLLRNIMALEQCHHPDQTYICDYIVLMHTLIYTSKDVELLVRNSIIFNRLGSNDVLANLFNNLCQDIITNNYKSYFHRLCEDMTEYYENPWNRWKITLKRDYINTPWPIASTIAAVTLLLLTLMQTVIAFISLWR